MAGRALPDDTAAGGICPFCALPYMGRPNRCPRCGTLLGEAALDIKREGARARRIQRTRKALSDLLFLVGLLLGGPMMTLGDNLQLGLFIALAGALASVLRRYTEWSTAGPVLVGGSAAAVVASVVVGTPPEAPEANQTREGARMAYTEALAAGTRDVLVEPRGPGAVTLWLTVPEALSGSCGDYPPEEVREHLRELGFLRVVVMDRNRSGGLCSFHP